MQPCSAMSHESTQTCSLTAGGGAKAAPTISPIIVFWERKVPPVCRKEVNNADAVFSVRWDANRGSSGCGAPVLVLLFFLAHLSCLCITDPVSTCRNCAPGPPPVGIAPPCGCIAPFSAPCNISGLLNMLIAWVNSTCSGFRPHEKGSLPFQRRWQLLSEQRLAASCTRLPAWPSTPTCIALVASAASIQRVC